MRSFWTLWGQQVGHLTFDSLNDYKQLTGVYQYTDIKASKCFSLVRYSAATHRKTSWFQSKLGFPTLLPSSVFQLATSPALSHGLDLPLLVSQVSILNNTKYFKFQIPWGQRHFSYLWALTSSMTEQPPPERSQSNWDGQEMQMEVCAFESKCILIHHLVGAFQRFYFKQKLLGN